MKILWIDTLREPSQFGYPTATWAKSYTEAIRLLTDHTYDFMSLEYDLSDGSSASMYQKNNGYDILCWLSENKKWPSMGVTVHGANPRGKYYMHQLIESHYGKYFYKPEANVV